MTVTFLKEKHNNLIKEITDSGSQMLMVGVTKDIQYQQADYLFPLVEFYYKFNFLNISEKQVSVSAHHFSFSDIPDNLS